MSVERLVDLDDLQKVHDAAHVPYGTGLGQKPPCRWCLLIKEAREWRESAIPAEAKG